MGKKSNIIPAGSCTLHSGIVVDTYPGDLILNDLSTKSPEFRTFYESEKKNFFENIVWLKANPSFASSLAYQMGQHGKFVQLMHKGTTEKFLILDEIPPKTEGSILVAHELMHTVVFNEGFPQVGAIKSEAISSEIWHANSIIASKLTSMIHDILVDSRLKMYGFNFTPLLERKYKGHINSMKNRSEKSLDRINYTLTLFDYVLAILQGMVILEEENTNYIHYKKKFSEIFPKIAKEGQMLVSAIQATGYDTPEQVKCIYQNIMKIMDLNNGFRLVGDEMN